MLPNFPEFYAATRSQETPQEYGPEFRGWRFELPEEAARRAERRERRLLGAILAGLAALAWWAAV